jgi:hypothetical protein
VTAVSTAINEGPDSVTVTPDTTALELSMTTPLIAPVVAVTA